MGVFITDKDGKLKKVAGNFIPKESPNLGCLRTEVLWTNPSPTKSFDTSTIISLGSNNYSYLLIEYMAYPTIYASMIVPFKEEEGSIYYSLSDTNTSNSTYFVQLGQRKFTINSSNQIKFGDGYWVNHSEKLLLNNYMIPTKITGIIKQPAMIYTGAELHEGNGIKIENGMISSDLQYTQLWENPDVNSPFPAQTITLDLTNYKFLMITFYSRGDWKTQGYYFSNIIPIDGTTYTACYFDINNKILKRPVTATESGVNFGEGNSPTASESVWANQPLKIYGI